MMTQYWKAALCIALLLLAGTAVSADDPAPRILVSGQGSVELAPDMAVLELTVTREGDTARAALDASSAAMAEVLAAMREQGIAERDLQTTNFSIQPKYVYPQRKATGDTEPPRIVGYTVRNGLAVRVRDIGRVGAVIDRAVTLGVNEGGNIAFTNDDPSAALARARTLAVKDALGRAKTLAAAAGVKAGRLLEISEQSFMPGPVPMIRAEKMMAAADAAVPVATGENSYRVTVNLAVAIEQ